MTDAPEKIWAWSEPCGKGVQKFWIQNPKMVDGSETAYIRADIHEALEAENKRLREEVAAYIKAHLG